MEATASFSQAVSTNESWKVALTHPDGYSLVDDYQARYQFSEQHEMYGIKQHLTIAAWAGETPIGLISVDNLMTQRMIDQEQIEIPWPHTMIYFGNSQPDQPNN